MDFPTRHLVGKIQYYISSNKGLKNVIEFGGNHTFINYDDQQEITITDHVLNIENPNYKYAFFDYNDSIPDVLKSKFDLAISINSLYYATNIVFSIKQFIESLKPGGILFICLPFNYPWTDKHLPQYRISPLTIKEILDQAGGSSSFKFIGSKYFLFPIYLHRFFYFITGSTLNLGKLNKKSKNSSFVFQNEIDNFENCLWYLVEFKLNKSRSM